MSAYDSETGLDFDPDMKGPDRTFVKFSLDAVKNNFKSEQEGRAVYDDKEFVTITIPGKRGFTAYEEVTDEHKRKWPGAYRAFKEGLEPPVHGTPIEQWPVLTPAMVLNMRTANIRTVEDIANMDDAGVQSLGLGAQQLRTKAKAFLSEDASGAALSKAIADADSKAVEIANLKAQMGDMAARLTAMEKEKAK